MANRLARETSPYLRQHAGNPVDWYPWGEEALARAARETWNSIVGRAGWFGFERGTDVLPAIRVGHEARCLEDSAVRRAPQRFADAQTLDQEAVLQTQIRARETQREVIERQVATRRAELSTLQAQHATLVRQSEIIGETLAARTSERQGRVIDKDGAGAMERKKQEGYF